MLLQNEHHIHPSCLPVEDHFDDIVPAVQTIPQAYFTIFNISNKLRQCVGGGLVFDSFNI